MAEKGLDSRYNFVNWLKLNGADGATLNMGEGLFEKNEVLQDMDIMPANAEMHHEDLRATSIPTPQIVKIGDGWDASVVQWDKYSDDLSIFRDRATFPEDMLRLGGDMAGKRMQVEKQHVEGFSQGVVNHLFHGTSAADPEKFDGLDVRYKTPDANDPWAPSSAGDYGVVDAGGTGSDTTSIWLIQWGAEKCSLRTPKNDPHGGLRREDMGRHQVTAENSKLRWDYITEFEWTLGLSIKDVRSVVRIRNIESAISAVDTSIVHKIIEASEYFWGNEPVFMYMNRSMRAKFRILIEQKMNVMFSSDNPYNIKFLMFDDMIIRRCDSILNTETAVAAA